MPEHGSGDLLADRRFAYAEALLAEGDAAAAADLLAQVLERVPGWAPAWAALGAAEERRGDPGTALAAYREAEARDPGGVLGAGLHRARLAGEPAPAGMPASYVAALFDGYAPRFDAHLLEGLAYRAPAALLEALDACGCPGPFGVALDLGCGTGLMGRAVRPRVERLEGVDLSAGMVERARATGCYDALAVGDVVAALRGRPPECLDLVLAADVLVYLGDLAPVLAAAARGLRAGGVLAFTLQRAPDGTAVRLGDDLRFAHAPSYVGDALAGAGLRALAELHDSTRTEKGHPVPGLVIVAAKP